MSELLARLDELGAELKVRDRPERRAWSRLEPTRNGWTTRLYDDQAFTLWHDVLRRFPDDLSAVHHLAIMHHARAIDVEQSAHPGQSDEDWRQALALWHRLFQSDEFWTELSERVDATPDLVPQVREELAERLLRLHFDIALDEQSPHHRARFHVKLARAAPFPTELVERVRGRAYERAIEGVDPAVWSGTFEPEAVWPAIETVIHYLDLDDDCVPALKDLLKLLKQVQTGQVQAANGSTGRRDGDQALDDLRTTAKKYDSYVARLEPLLLKESEQDTLVLSDLALWLSRAAQASSMRRAHDDAAGYYDRALRAARAGGDPRADEFSGERLYSLALAARECAADDKEKAKRLLAGVMKADRVPGIVRLTRAQAWLLLGDFDRADADLNAAMAVFRSPETDVPGPQVATPAELHDEGQSLREQIDQIRKHEKFGTYLDRAADAIKERRWTDGVLLMDIVLEIDKGYTPALVRRAECQLGRCEVDAAKVDLDRAERLIRGAGGDERALEAVRQLRLAHRELRKRVSAAGGPKAARFQQAGIKAYNEERFEKAIELLRSARTAAGTRVPQLDEDLALSLNAQACKLVEPFTNGSLDVLRGLFSGSSVDQRGYLGRNLEESILGKLSLPGLGSGLLDPIRRAEQLLVEADRLHSTPTIKQNLEQVRLLRRRLEGTW